MTYKDRRQNRVERTRKDAAQRQAMQRLMFKRMTLDIIRENQEILKGGK